MKYTTTEEVVFDPGQAAWVVAVGPTGVRKVTVRHPERAVWRLVAWRLRKARTFAVSVRPNTLLRRSDVYVEECDTYEAAVLRASLVAEHIRQHGVDGLGETAS